MEGLNRPGEAKGLNVASFDILDDPVSYKRLDPTSFRDRIAGLPDQCRRAWDQGLQLSLPRSYASVDKVVIAGMGGSAIGGALLADLLAAEDAPPVFVCRDYSLPRYVDARTLVIVSSYSGNTEEALSAFHQARMRKCKVLCVTTGGKLGYDAANEGWPVFTVDHEGEPRTALGYSLLAPLAALQGLKLVRDRQDEVEDAVAVLRSRIDELGEGVPSQRNAAKTLAHMVHGKIAVIYGAGLLKGAAYRWKAQINENAKGWAFADEIPEANHSSVVGYAMPDPAGRMAVVMLASQFLHPRTLRRYHVTGELLAQVGVRHHLIEGRGTFPLAHLLSCVLMGDYTSYYLGLLNGVDPSPTVAIDVLKARLAGRA